MKNCFKIFGIIVLAAALISCGYFIGSRAGENSIVSALPHISGERMDMEAAEPPPVQEEANEDTDKPETEDTAAEPEETGRTVIKADVSETDSSWSVIKKYRCDLFETGENAEIILYTSAQTENGEILWNDDQNWVLEVSDGEGGYYTLLEKYISNGNIYFDVNELESGEKAVTVFIKTGAGFEIKQYTYGKNGFVEATLYNSGLINNIYSSIPDYK